MKARLFFVLMMCQTLSGHAQAPQRFSFQGIARKADGGNGYLNGFIVQTSDRRLKRNFIPVSASLTKISHLNGYHYYWKDKAQDQSLQTGVIAQEVEELFPELVKTDEKGFKSVNYSGLIPHLIECIKALKSQNEDFSKVNAEFRGRLLAVEKTLKSNGSRQEGNTSSSK